MNEASDGHWDRGMFGLRQSQPQILGGKRRGHPWWAVMLFDDLPAIRFMHFAIEQRIGEDIERGVDVDTVLAQQREDFPHAFQRQRRQDIAG